MAYYLPSTITGQDNLDVIFKVYAGLAYKDLDLTQYPMGTAADVTGWTDVSEDVTYNGSLAVGRTSSTVRFDATLSGVNYNAAYFGPGQGILCLIKVTVSGAQLWPTNNFVVFFVGHIMEGGHEDDYKHGGKWTRQLGGLDSLLQRSTAPRLGAGKINLLSSAAVTASSTLETPGIEAGSGEFAGSLANVDPENTIDSNINTLWISSGMPHSAELPDNAPTVSKVFLNPLPGYDQTKLWWIELRGTGTDTPGPGWIITNQDGVSIWATFSETRPSRVTLCANQAYLETYFGTEFDSSVMLDARTLRHGKGKPGDPWVSGPLTDDEFTLNPTAGWIQFWDAYNGDIRGAVAWNQDGSNVHIDGWGPGVLWDTDPSPAINISGATGHWGLAHDADGGVLATDWSIVQNIFPGNSHEAEEVEWLFYALEQQSSALAANVSAGAIEITLPSTRGLLDSGTAACELTDIFTYTGRTATSLTGIPATGANAIGAHLKDATIHQVVNDVVQYGWPCRQLALLRPDNMALEWIMSGKVYFVPTSLIPPRMPGEDDWEEDYDANPLWFWDSSTVVDGVRDHGFRLAGPDDGPRWVQYMLIIFEDMGKGGRARLNEARLYLAQTQIDNSNLGDIDTLSSAGLARYLLSLAGIATPWFNVNDSNHLIGEHATAIMPYTRVLDDLARISGCVIYWANDGTVTWRHDMWWPVGFEQAQIDPVAILDSTCLQGTVQYIGRRPDEVGVRIHARTPDSVKQYIASYPPNPGISDQLIELDDLVVSAPEVVTQLAETMYYKNGLNYTQGAQEIIFSVKGHALWLYPEQYVRIPVISDTGVVVDLADYDGEIHALNSWLIESVTWEWGTGDNNVRTWKTTARGRRYWR